MRILIFSTNYLPKLGGVELVVDNLATRFVEYGHNVALVTVLSEPRQNQIESRNGFTVHRMLLGVPHRFWKCRSLIKFPFRAMHTIYTLFRLVRELDPEVISLFFVDDAAR